MSAEPDVPFAYDGLDRVIHEKARLGILPSLAGRPDGLAFNDLTQGNLSRHLAVLQEAGLVDIHKGYTGNRPLTEIHLTPAGRQRFLDYLSVLERVVRDASARAEQAAPGKPQVA